MYPILAAILLLAVYVFLLAIEARRGARYLEPYRARLDRAVRGGELILAHIDLSRLAREEALHLARRLAHAATEAALRGVRSIEALLIRLIRRLRLHPEVPRPAGASTRAFVRTLSEFKGHIESTRPEFTKVH